MKAWKLDLWITLAALTVSGLTAAAALYQSRVFSDQLSATVWPYLSFDATMTNGGSKRPSSIELLLTNDGAGPAIIEGAEISLAGKRVASLAEVFSQFSKLKPGRGIAAFSYSSIERGQVIRPGASSQVARLVTTHFEPAFQAGYKKLSINVYYCSLLNACWVVRLHTNDRPQPIDLGAIPHTGVQPQ